MGYARDFHVWLTRQPDHHAPTTKDVLLTDLRQPHAPKATPYMTLILGNGNANKKKKGHRYGVEMTKSTACAVFRYCGK